MAKRNKAGEKTSAKGRNEDGQFAKGNDEGTKWTDKDGDNPAPPGPGRTPYKGLTESLLNHLDKPASDFTFAKKACKQMGLDPTDMTCGDALMAAALFHGVKGKGDYLKILLDRAEGAVPKHMNFGVDDPVQKYIEHMLDMTAPEPPPDESEDEGPAE